MRLSLCERKRARKRPRLCVRGVAFVPSQTDFINEVKTLLMKLPVFVLIRLVNENKHHFLCVAENSNATSVRRPPLC